MNLTPGTLLMAKRYIQGHTDTCHYVVVLSFEELKSMFMGATHRLTFVGNTLYTGLFSRYELHEYFKIVGLVPPEE